MKMRCPRCGLTSELRLHSPGPENGSDPQNGTGPQNGHMAIDWLKGKGYDGEQVMGDNSPGLAKRCA